MSSLEIRLRALHAASLASVGIATAATVAFPLCALFARGASALFTGFVAVTAIELKSC
jgi:hypothetical protein